jgi:hypothetical protein
MSKKRQKSPAVKKLEHALKSAEKAAQKTNSKPSQLVRKVGSALKEARLEIYNEQG